MRYALINVTGTKYGQPCGLWIQNHVGTLETAIQVAIETERVNGNKIDVAVVEEVCGPGVGLRTHYCLERLDEQRNKVEVVSLQL